LNLLGLVPLALGLLGLYHVVFRGKPKGPYGSGIGLTEQLIHQLPDKYWRIVWGLIAATLVVVGVGGTFFGWG
jgi:hypothetical protein